METIKSKVQDVAHRDKTMESSGKGKTVLVTGGSGFVAAHILNSFLSRGYNVKTTVRSDSSAEKIKKSHAKYLSQISFAIVPDVATPGGHDEAVKGVDGVSPRLSYHFPKPQIDIECCAGNPHSLPLPNEGRKQRARPTGPGNQGNNVSFDIHPKPRSQRKACNHNLLLRIHHRHEQEPAARIHLHRKRLEPRDLRGSRLFLRLWRNSLLGL